MPTYQYACTECHDQFEVVQKFSDDALTECPHCAGRLRKVFSAVGVVFKGSGFYRTDSRATGTSSSPATAASGSAASAGSGSSDKGSSSSSDSGSSGSTGSGSTGGSSTGSGSAASSGSTGSSGGGAPAP